MTYLGVKTTKPTVLITGGAGYIGSHAVLDFQDAGYHVVVVDNLSTGTRSLVPDTADFYELDLQNIEAVRQVIQRHKPAAIVHFAGSIIVTESMEQPLSYYHNNAVNSFSLISLAVNEGVKAFLFSSTAAVYGVPETLPIRETAALKPINPYGRSKLMTETMLHDAHERYGLHIGMLRYFNVAGADAAGRTGQCSKRATHLLKIAAEAMVGKRDHVAIYGDDYDTPDGTCVRDYVHVSDLANAHVLALQHILDYDTPLIANCGYGKGYSVREMLDAAASITGTPIKVIVDGRRAGDPPSLVADNQHIQQVLGWTPQFDALEVMIQSAVDWEGRLVEKKRKVFGQ